MPTQKTFEELLKKNPGSDKIICCVNIQFYPLIVTIFLSFPIITTGKEAGLYLQRACQQYL